MLDVYTMNVNDIDLSKNWEISPKRAEKTARLKHDNMKKQSIAADVLINRGMKEKFPNIKTPVIWDYDQYGKPYFTDFPEIYMNISHSGDYTVCVLSDSPVGIDIQHIREVGQNVLKRYFTDEEQEYVGSDIERFYELWVRKESFSKAVGRGLQLPLKGISVLDDTVFYENTVYEFTVCDIDKDYKMCISKKISV